MYPIRRSMPLRDFFSGVAEQTFQSQLGVADPPLIDYLVDLLVRFIRSDAVFHTRNAEGKRLHAVADMMLEAEERSGEAKRSVHRHIGDFTLFWAGVYPEALNRLQARGGKDHLIEYFSHGKRAYRIASALPSPNPDENAVLERLSSEFELCVYGLGEVRREWERQDPRDPESGPWLIN